MSDHYTRTKIEPVAVWADWNLDPFIAAVLKYLCRAGHKPGESVESDLRKAVHFIDLRAKHIGGRSTAIPRECALSRVAVCDDWFPESETNPVQGLLMMAVSCLALGDPQSARRLITGAVDLVNARVEK